MSSTFWFVIGLITWVGCSSALLRLEYRKYKQGRGDLKTGNPLNIWWLYYLIPILIPLAFVGGLFARLENRKTHKKWRKEYEETGLLFWPYLEYRLKEDKKLTALLRTAVIRTVEWPKPFIGNASIYHVVDRLIQQMSPDCNNYGFFMVSENSAVGLIDKQVYHLSTGIVNCFDTVSVKKTKPLDLGLTIDSVMRSYQERHWGAKEFPITNILE